ncbi:hypothetical protein F511_34208 [Dorcoceras hygrometricum]|uniref:Uncharacterized protein n=1 Tax=Dorcoceras hygrometricum TaxID=472368 RepID=A0A2Z7AZC5_9LAMI|nr:hypothetical protein F511_34208 [Dorcoceras hygrometricum]
MRRRLHVFIGNLGGSRLSDLTLINGPDHLGNSNRHLGGRDRSIWIIRAYLINGRNASPRGSWFSSESTNPTSIQPITCLLINGLAAGDTPDAPHYHLGTRGPSSMPQAPTEDSCSDWECCPRTVSNRIQPEYVFPYIPENREEYLVRDTRCRRIFIRICSSSPSNPSINTRHQEEAPSIR